MTDTHYTEVTRIEVFADVLCEIIEIASACAFVGCVLVYAALAAGVL